MMIDLNMVKVMMLVLMMMMIKRNPRTHEFLIDIGQTGFTQEPFILKDVRGIARQPPIAPMMMMLAVEMQFLIRVHVRKAAVEGWERAQGIPGERGGEGRRR